MSGLLSFFAWGVLIGLVFWLLGGVVLRVSGSLLAIGGLVGTAATGSPGTALASVVGGLAWLAGHWLYAVRHHHYYSSPLARRVFVELLPRPDAPRGSGASVRSPPSAVPARLAASGPQGTIDSVSTVVPIYLDHQATTPVDTRVLEAMLPYFTERFGNAASSQHARGREAADAVHSARMQVAGLLGADRREVFFLSGATEANNLALKGLASSAHRRQIVTAATEHPAVLGPLRTLAAQGFEITVLDVDGDGLPNLDALAAVVSERTLLVSLAAANNEIGTMLPLRAIAEIVHAHGALLHSDAAQAVGKIDLDVERDGIDLLSISAHKLYGPKGVGALYVRRDSQRLLSALIDGGGHERGLRSGTLNVPGIVGLGAACEIAGRERVAEAGRLVALRDRFLAGLRDHLDDVELNGPTTRLPGNLNLRFLGVDSEALMANCPDLAFSAGSACSSATPTLSHVLLAIGLAEEAAEQSVRFGFGRLTSTEDIDAAVQRLVAAVTRVRGMSRAAEPVGTS
jgi:cysteine desulfurase